MGFVGSQSTVIVGAYSSPPLPTRDQGLCLIHMFHPFPHSQPFPALYQSLKEGTALTQPYLCYFTSPSFLPSDGALGLTGSTTFTEQSGRTQDNPSPAATPEASHIWTLISPSRPWTQWTLGLGGLLWEVTVERRGLRIACQSASLLRHPYLGSGLPEHTGPVSICFTIKEGVHRHQVIGEVLALSYWDCILRINSGNKFLGNTYTVHPGFLTFSEICLGPYFFIFISILIIKRLCVCSRNFKHTVYTEVTNNRLPVPHCLIGTHYLNLFNMHTHTLMRENTHTHT